MIAVQLTLYCLLFTGMVRYAVRGGVIDGLFFYPKLVQERAFEIGLITPEKMKKKRKIFMTQFYIVMFVALVFIIGVWNHVADFKAQNHRKFTRTMEHSLSYERKCFTHNNLDA